MANKQIEHEMLQIICNECDLCDKILVVTDETNKDIGMMLWNNLKRFGFPQIALVIMADRKTHNEEPPEVVAASMTKADVIFLAITLSLSNNATVKNANTSETRGIDYLNCNIKVYKS